MDSHDHALATRFDSHSIERQLHDVPPHEVSEVRVDGRRAVYKRDVGPTGRAGVEGRVLALVRARTRVPVPEVLALGDDWFVADWHPDAPVPDASGEATEAWARAAGRGLATLHDETEGLLDGYGRLGVDGDSLALPDEPDWHAAALASVRRLAAVLDDHGHGDVADAALDYLRAHPDAFAGSGDPVLCHGWWSPEHVAVREGEVACALDFEHAMAAPDEWDYWRTVLPVFDGGSPQTAFREGYESVRELPAGIERRRSGYTLLHTLYFFESLYVQDQHGEAQTERRADGLRDHVLDLLENA